MGAEGYNGLPSYYIQSSDPLTPNFGFSLKGMDPIIAENFVLADTAIAAGSGSKVQINGSSVTNPNFNNTTPAAPSGNVNVTWQVSGSSVSAYVPNATPGGSTTDIQFNDGGVFGGAATLTWDKVNKNLVFGNQTGLQLNGNYIFSGSFSNLWQLYPVISASGQTTVIDLEPTTTSTVGSNDLTAFQIVHTLAAGALNTSYFSAAAIQTDRTTGDTGTITTFIGLDVDCFNDAGSVTNQSGVFCSSSNNGSGTIDNNAGLRVAHGVVAGTNTVDAGIHINSPLTSGTSLGTCYGLYIDDQTTGGAKNPNPYAIFVAGGKSSFKSVLLTSTLVDGASSVGTSGQVLSSTVTGVAWVNATPMTTLGDIIYENATPAPARLAGNTTSTKMYLSQTGTGSISAVPAWAQINYADITGTTPTPPSGSVLWSALGNASANLTLSNAGFTTTFNQTSNVAWTWANTTAATSSVSQSSPIHTLAGTYWNGAASATDSWTFQSVLANGTNGQSVLTVAHSGSTNATINIPAGSATNPALGFTGFNDGFYGMPGAIWATNRTNAIIGLLLAASGVFSGIKILSGAGFNWSSSASDATQTTDTGITRIAAKSLAIGNGTAGDTTGTLSLGTILKYNGVATVASGVPAQYATIDLTGQTGSIGTTTLYAVPSSGAGLYRLSYYLDVSTAGTGGTVTATFGWNDGNSAETLTSAAVNLNALSGGYTQGVITFYSSASQNITYATTVTSALGSPQYILRSRLEFLG